MRNDVIKLFIELFVGISKEQNFPAFQKISFEKWLKKEGPDQSAYDEQVIYFPGCNVNYIDHELGRNLIKILNKMNIGITIPDNRCCGVPAIANSNVKTAKKYAGFNISSLAGAIKGTDKRIILTCSSGNLALKYEYKNFLELDNSAIFNKTDYITAYLYNKFKQGNIPLMKRVNIRAAYHSPCHLERIGGVMFTIDILKRIPGLDLVILHSECCGMSGTYGFKKEYSEISRSIGENLFKKIDDANPEIVITDCVTCKWQIENFTPYRVLHPINILAMAI